MHSRSVRLNVLGYSKLVFMPPARHWLLARPVAVPRVRKSLGRGLAGATTWPSSPSEDATLSGTEGSTATPDSTMHFQGVGKIRLAEVQNSGQIRSQAFLR